MLVGMWNVTIMHRRAAEFAPYDRALILFLVQIWWLGVVHLLKRVVEPLLLYVLKVIPVK